MRFLRVHLFTLISYYLLLHLGFCKAYQNCLVALIKITTVESSFSPTSKRKKCLTSIDWIKLFWRTEVFGVRFLSFQLPNPCLFHTLRKFEQFAAELFAFGLCLSEAEGLPKI